MTHSDIEHPEIRLVVPPTTMYGDPKNGKPRMRHIDGDCQHFKWPHGVVGTPQQATDDEMRTLPACTDCVARNDADRRGYPATAYIERPAGPTCPTCSIELPATGRCDECD